jgi:Flp pilus assembly protein TadG
MRHWRSKVAGLLGKRLAELARDRRGTTATLFAVAAVPLFLAAGVGIDTGRGYMVKSRLSSALDAAALAGGRSFFLTTRDADIQMYFDANFPAGYMGSTVTGPAIVVDEAAETVRLEATATFPTTFMRVAGFETMDVSAFVEVKRQLTAIDLVLSIDISGSMASSAAGGGTRISAARTAATELVNILFGTDATKEFLKIGLVPWSSKVKIWLDGTTYSSSGTTWTTVPSFTNPVTGASQSRVYYANNSPVPLLSAPPSDWKGCTYDRYLKDGTVNDGDIWDVAGTIGNRDWMAWEPVGPEGEPVAGYGRCSSAIGYNECIACPNHGTTPLQNAKQTILDAINALQSPTGNTNIPGGLGWAWRVLTKEVPFDQAGPDDPQRRKTKAIVLLTDGENVGGSGDGYKGVFGIGSAALPSMNARLLTLAGNIKATGVVLYVVQFANAGTELQTLLKNVASGPNAPYYHYAPDAATLQQVFREVANHISELRLSQ